MNLEKKAQGILKSIENGKATEANIDSLTEMLDMDPSIAPEIMEVLNNLLLKGEAKACRQAILALSRIAENNPGYADISMEVILDCMQKRKHEFHEDSILSILEILIRITQKNPEQMGTAVPELLLCLKNTSTTVREKAYFLLVFLALTHHEFFRGNSKNFIQVLNGLNLDERIKACRLIRKIAEKDRTIVAETYDLLEDFHLNHPDSILRSEAGFAIDRLKDSAEQKSSMFNGETVNSAQRFLFSSPSKNEAEVSDRSFSDFADLVTPDEKDIMNALEEMGLKHLVASEDAVKKRGAPENKEVIPAPSRITVLPNGNKNIAATPGMAGDIPRIKTEEMHHMNETEPVNSNKSDFFTIASHDLRTPLNSVIGFSELLRQGKAGGLNEKQEHYINNVISSSRELLDLISDILDMSTAEAGKIELDIEKVSVQATIDVMFNLIKEKAIKNNVVLKIGIDSALDFIEVDKQRFEQILFNLLGNAIKFSKPGGTTITIIAKREGDMAKFSVSDTGIGIKKEDMGKLFKEFVRLDPGKSGRNGGSGLGLAISKRLVEMHRGKIWAESTYGEGSTFTFLLPINNRL